MELSEVRRDEVPREAIRCAVQGHAHLYAKLPTGDWLVAAVPGGRPMIHARDALLAIPAESVADLIDDAGQIKHQSQLGLRDDVKLFVVDLDDDTGNMSEEEAEDAKLDFGAAPPRAAAAVPEPEPEPEEEEVAEEEADPNFELDPDEEPSE